MNEHELSTLSQEIISELDQFGREYDNYEYGLPIDDENLELMESIVTKILLQKLNTNNNPKLYSNDKDQLF